MGVTTRSASNSPVKKHASTTNTPTTGADTEAESTKVLILPRNLSADARILSLRHPRDATRKRFLFCPVHGLFEFTRIAQPPSEYRSLLFSSTPESTDDGAPVQSTNDRAKISDGYISKDAFFLVATPFDLFFLFLSLLPSPMAGSSKALFQPMDDLLEIIMEEDKHLRYIITRGRPLVEAALRRFCDTVEAGDDTMFRVSEEKTTKLIHSKISRMVEKGLPPSMEERFVTRALETPVLSVKREATATMEIETPSEEDPKLDSFDSQSSAPSTAPSVVFSEVSTATSFTTVSNDATAPQILDLQRQKVALDFIVASYLSPKIADHIAQYFHSPESPIVFSTLDAHLTQLAKLKAEALASRSLGDFSRKRGLDEEELAEERAEKKRKQDEEDKRKKASQSRGVKELAKVNVTGMKKMSAFFMKKPSPTAGGKQKA